MPEAYPRPVRAITVTATGPALPGAGVLYFARLTGTGGATAVLKDGAEVVLALAVPSGGTPDDWPKSPVALAYDKGLTAEITGTAVLALGYDTRR